MAATQTITLNPTNSGSHKAVTVTAVFTETSTNTTNNTSTINYTVKLTRNAWTTSFYHTQNQIRVTLTINGTSIIVPIPAYNYSYTWDGKITTPSSKTYNGGTSVTYPKSTSITYADSTKANGQSSPPIGGTNLGAVTVTHNADGTKTITVGASITDSAGETYTTGSASSTASMVLTAIPRATQPTVSPTAITINSSADTTVTISTPRASSAFTHTLKYKFGTNITETQFATGVTTSYSWAVPANILNYLKTSASGTCTVYCYTYNGSTLIGSKTTTFTISAGTSLIPTMGTIGTITDSVYSSKNFGVFLRGRSKLSIASIASGSGTASYSDISSYSFNIQQDNNIVSSGSGYTTIAALKSAIESTNLSYSGTNVLSVYCVDSRNRTSTAKTASISVIDYSEPTISIDSSSSGRCTSGGVIDPDDGTYFKVKATYGKTNINSKNTGTISIRWKETSSSTWSTPWPSSRGATETSAVVTSAVLGGGNIDVTKTYDVQITYSDQVASITINRTLASAFVLMDINNSGYALAFGKSSEATGSNQLLEIAMPTQFSNQTTLESMGLLNLIYPIGSIFETMTTTNPNTVFGGTWERITGVFLLAATDGGSSGASQAAGNTDTAPTHTHGYAHTHGIAHTHGVPFTHYHNTSTAYAKWNHHDGYMYFKEKTGVTAYAPGGRAAITGSTYSSTNQTDALELAGLTGSAVNSSWTAITSVTTNSQSTSTTASQSTSTTDGTVAIPPYLSIYIWKRTA